MNQSFVNRSSSVFLSLSLSFSVAAEKEKKEMSIIAVVKELPGCSVRRGCGGGAVARCSTANTEREKTTSTIIDKKPTLSKRTLFVFVCLLDRCRSARKDRVLDRRVRAAGVIESSSNVSFSTRSMAEGGSPQMQSRNNYSDPMQQSQQGSSTSVTRRLNVHLALSLV